MNRAQILGHVGADPEIRSTGSGTSVANLRLATNERWKDKDGTPHERTEWHRVILWGKLAELVGEHVRKGTELLVEGRLQTREWNDKDGVVHYTTEIVAETARWFARRPPAGDSRSGRPDDGIRF